MSRFEAMRTRIGARLRERRRASGMAQEQFAGRIAVPRLSLTGIELGHRPLKLSKLGLVCEALGCSADDLLGDPALAQAAKQNTHRRYDGLAQC